MLLDFSKGKSNQVIATYKQLLDDSIAPAVYDCANAEEDSEQLHGNFIGNDIVDLAEAAANSPHRRFRSRCFNEAELRWIGSCDRSLWATWAAKEAAYKAFAQSVSSIPGIPMRFRVEWDRAPGSAREHSISGTVRFDGRAIRVLAFQSSDFIHCIASTDFRRRFSRVAWMTRGSVRLENESRVARTLAQVLMRNFGLTSTQIRRPIHGRALAPPAVYRRGALLKGIRLSLSHHGRFAAAAVAYENLPGAC
jgi:phosphopantetheinyl transferase (holo-ACP synthase)